MRRLRPTVVEVDLESIRHNVRTLTPETAELMAVVKGDAYGHGDVPVALAALEAGATWLGVALVEEGVQLREAGINAPILVLSEFPRGAETEAIAAGLTPTIYTPGGLQAVATAGTALGRPVTVHVKVDTGMHRVGLWPPETAASFVAGAIAAGLEVEGLWTHLARAEDDASATRGQLELFTRLAEQLPVRPRLLHAANSAATILHPESHLDLVRPGIALYGLPPGPGVGDALGLEAALAWRSAVSMTKRLAAGEALSYGHRYRLEREATIATVPVGYEDGYLRIASDRAEVLIRGRRHRVAGMVTMDQLLVDCGDEAVAEGDEVTLIGPQGNEEISATELAGHMGTIPYELVTTISERVPREYLDG